MPPVKHGAAGQSRTDVGRVRTGCTGLYATAALVPRRGIKPRSIRLKDGSNSRYTSEAMVGSPGFEPGNSAFGADTVTSYVSRPYWPSRPDSNRGLGFRRAP